MVRRHFINNKDSVHCNRQHYPLLCYEATAFDQVFDFDSRARPRLTSHPLTAAAEPHPHSRLPAHGLGVP